MGSINKSFDGGIQGVPYEYKIIPLVLNDCPKVLQCSAHAFPVRTALLMQDSLIKTKFMARVREGVKNVVANQSSVADFRKHCLDNNQCG